MFKKYVKKHTEKSSCKDNVAGQKKAQQNERSEMEVNRNDSQSLKVLRGKITVELAGV